MTAGVQDSAPPGRIGLVILTHDRRRDAARCVRHALALPERPEIVVVDNASSGGAADMLARRFPRVRVIACPVNLGAAGRNRGVAALATPYVAFCDDDARWAPGSLARAARLLDAHPRLGLVTGRVLVGGDAREDPACAFMRGCRLPGAPGQPGVAVLSFLASAAMVRRAAFLAAGGFEARLFLGGEEELLAMDLAAAGWWLSYADDVVVHHDPSPRRDAPARQRLLLRNALWCAWLRRRWPGALARTVHVLRRTPRPAERLVVLGAAAAGLPWVLGQRAPIPPALEEAWCALDRQERLAGRQRPGPSVPEGTSPSGTGRRLRPRGAAPAAPPPRSTSARPAP